MSVPTSATVHMPVTLVPDPAKADGKPAYPVNMTGNGPPTSVGETGQIYVDIAANIAYVWTGASWVAISGAGGSGWSGLMTDSITGQTYALGVEDGQTTWTPTSDPGVIIQATNPVEIGLLDSPYSVPLSVSHVLVDSATGPVTVVLPAVDNGRAFYVRDVGNNASVNNITVGTINAKLIEGLLTYAITTNREGWTFLFSTDLDAWLVI